MAGIGRNRQAPGLAAASRLTGLVIGSHRRHYRVRLADSEELECVIRGRTLAVACGDQAIIARTTSGQGVIEDIAERRTLLYRADEFRTKIIAANLTQVVGVVAVEPAWNPDLLDRWIVAAEANHCRFVIVLNKIDLPAAAAAARSLDGLRRLGYPVVELCARQDVSPLSPQLAGQHSVLVGQSGMGKSTLINALVPGAQARIGNLSAARSAGRHTTTSTILYPLPGDGWIVDSPGMHEFGLAHLPRAAIEAGFREMLALAGHCRFRDCSHTHEPDCAAIAAVERGELDSRRLASLRRLLAEQSAR